MKRVGPSRAADAVGRESVVQPTTRGLAAIANIGSSCATTHFKRRPGTIDLNQGASKSLRFYPRDNSRFYP